MLGCVTPKVYRSNVVVLVTANYEWGSLQATKGVPLYYSKGYSQSFLKYR